MNGIKNKGITLISLVITIIIMLILAGVVITLVLGNNGLIGRAKEAKEETNKQIAIEQINLKITNSIMKKYVEEQREPTLQELADDFCNDEEIEYVELASRKLASLDKIEIGENKSFFIKLKKYPYEFEIGNSLKILNIDGEKIEDKIDGGDTTVSSEEVKQLKLKLEEVQKALDESKKEFVEYKKTVTEALTNNGIETTAEDSKEKVTENIGKIANVNFLKGVSSKFVKVAENLSSRYVQTVDVRSIANYGSFTVEDFVIVNKGMFWDAKTDKEDINLMTMQYSKENGILTLGKQKSHTNTHPCYWTFWNTYDVYVFVGK